MSKTEKIMKTPLVQPINPHNPGREGSRVFNPLAWRHSWVVCAVLLGLAGCAQAPKSVSKKTEEQLLVFPLPPDDPRFVYERTIRGSRDVDTALPDNSLEELLTGRSTTATNVLFRKPYGVAVHQGRIFVSEPSTRIVKVFDVPGDNYFTIGEEEPGRLAMPIGLDVDGAGNLYVADVSAKAIMVYNRDGNFLRKLAGGKLGEPDIFIRLGSVTVDKKGERIYAVDAGGTRAAPENHRVRVFDAKTGDHLFDIGKRGSAPGEFNIAKDAVLDKDNNLYVVDGGNFRVQVFDTQGKFLREFGKLGQQFGDFSRPKEISIDPAGNVYVIDAGFQNFQIFTPDGKLLMAIGSGAGADRPAQYKLLSGVAVDEDGRVYVVDQQYKKVDIFRPASLGPQDGYLGRKAGANLNQPNLPAPIKEPADETVDEAPATDGLDEVQSP